MQDTFYRLFLMLHALPAYPRRIDTFAIEQQLAAADCYVSRRTIQRDLNKLSINLPIERDDAKPAGWCWSKDAKALTLPALDPHAALAWQLARAHLERLLPTATLEHLAPQLDAPIVEHFKTLAGKHLEADLRAILWGKLHAVFRNARAASNNTDLRRLAFSKRFTFRPADIHHLDVIGDAVEHQKGALGYGQPAQSGGEFVGRGEKRVVGQIGYRQADASHHAQGEGSAAKRLVVALDARQVGACLRQIFNPQGWPLWRRTGCRGRSRPCSGHPLREFSLPESASVPPLHALPASGRRCPGG